jgi:hypothetical protein
MFRKKKMPDVILRRYKNANGKYAYADLVHSFEAEGRRWCYFRHHLYLLRDDGTTIGDSQCEDVWEYL